MTDQHSKTDTDANDIVSPKNTEKLYGGKADEVEVTAGQEETLETSLPEDTDGMAEENMFSNPV